MKRNLGLRRFSSGFLIVLLITFIVAARMLIYRAGAPSFIPTIVLLAVFLILLALEPTINRRYPKMLPFYLLLQMLLIQVFGLLPPSEDVWGLLFIPLGFQAAQDCSRRLAIAWGSLFAAAMIVSLVLTEEEPIYGLGLGLFYAALGFFLVSYDLQYKRAEAAQQESQDLLAELQQAHQKLQEYAGQAEALAVEQERHHIASELHDSVSQVLFSITLTAEAVRMLLEKDPSGAAAELDRLQELTGGALNQMRLLISNWRNG